MGVLSDSAAVQVAAEAARRAPAEGVTAAMVFGAASWYVGSLVVTVLFSLGRGFVRSVGYVLSTLCVMVAAEGMVRLGDWRAGALVGGLFPYATDHDVVCVVHALFPVMLGLCQAAAASAPTTEETMLAALRASVQKLEKHLKLIEDKLEKPGEAGAKAGGTAGAGTPAAAAPPPPPPKSSNLGAFISLAWLAWMIYSNIFGKK